MYIFFLKFIKLLFLLLLLLLLDWSFHFKYILKKQILKIEVRTIRNLAYDYKTICLFDILNSLSY